MSSKKFLRSFSQRQKFCRGSNSGQWWQQRHKGILFKVSFLPLLYVFLMCITGGQKVLILQLFAILSWKRYLLCKGQRRFICLRFEKQHRLRSKVQISKTSKALTAQYCRNVNNFMFLLERRKREKNCENVRISFSGGTPQQLTF